MSQSCHNHKTNWHDLLHNPSRLKWVLIPQRFRGQVAQILGLKNVKRVHIGKSYGIMIKSHIFKSRFENIIFFHDFRTFPGLYPFHLVALVMLRTGIVFTLAITKKRFQCLQKCFIKTDLLGGLVLEEPL